jgi:hypothetical protein
MPAKSQVNTSFPIEERLHFYSVSAGNASTHNFERRTGCNHVSKCGEMYAEIMMFGKGVAVLILPCPVATIQG